MCCYNSDCLCLTIVLSIIAGVLLGILFGLGFLTAIPVFLIYLITGIAGVFFVPLYAILRNCTGESNCFCRVNKVLQIALIGTIITAAAGLIIASIASVSTVAIVLGISTFFIVLVLGTLLCYAKCICN